MRKLLLLILLLCVLFLSDIAPLLAQDDPETCPEWDEFVLEAILAACEDLEVEQICDRNGELIPLSDAERIVVGEDNPIVMIKTRAGRPEDSENVVTMLLFGAAEMTNVVIAPEDQPVTLTAHNIAGYSVNLRAGPGTNYLEAGTLDNNQAVVIDGQNAAGDWFHLQSDVGEQWVRGDFLALDGDASALRVVDSPYLSPMQAVTLVIGTPDFRCATSGLLLQFSGEETIQMQINGIDLEFAGAILLVKAIPNEMTEIMALAGEINVRAATVTLNVPTGALAQVTLGGENGLTPQEAPALVDTYSFAAIRAIPLDLLPGNPICLAGIGVDDETTTLYTGPSQEYSALFDSSAATHYVISGQADNWWQLDIPGYRQAWIPQSSVDTIGPCDEIAIVEAPAMATVDTGGGTTWETFLPVGQSVWMADTGQDVMTGTCVGSPIAMCNHPVAINPVGSNQLTWRGQEPSPYPMTQTGPNTYSYNGRNILGNGNVSLLLTFTSATTWEMTFATVFDDNPQCTHTFYYAAMRQW